MKVTFSPQSNFSKEKNWTRMIHVTNEVFIVLHPPINLDLIKWLSGTIQFSNENI